MTTSRRPLAVVVAAVAVAAVVGGGLLASARTPRSQVGAAAAPLSATVTAANASVPVKVPIDVAKLPTGRVPQLAYVRGRTVVGGVGTPVTVPGSVPIEAAARLWDTTLTVQVASATSSALVIQDHTGKVAERIKDVDSLATSADGKYVAYASGGQYALAKAGGKVYFQEPGTKPTAVLARPGYDLRVLAVLDRTVYFRSARSADATSWSLYEWDVDEKAVRTYASVASPVSVTRPLVAGIPVFTDSGLCSAVTDLDSGLQRWRTCQYRLDRFSPSNAFILGLPPTGGAPYGETRTAALDTKTGKLIREWTGPSLRGAVAEDDDHVLLLWHDRPEPQSRSAVVRCTVSTGQCELATPLSPEPVLLGS